MLPAITVESLKEDKGYAKAAKGGFLIFNHLNRLALIAYLGDCDLGD